MLTEEEKKHRREEYQKKQKKRIKIFLIICGVLMSLLIFAAYFWGMIGVNIHYGEGERSLKILSVSQKGLFWKTWEIEGVLFQDTGLARTLIWNFSIDNKDPEKEKLIQDVKTAFESGETVKVIYDQRMGSVPWRSKTSYFVKKIKIEN